MKNVPNQAFQKMEREHFKGMSRDAMAGYPQCGLPK